MLKIPVWSTVGGTYAFVWHQRKRFAALAFAPVLIASLVYVLFAWTLPTGAMAEIAEGKRSMAPLMFASAGAGLVSFLLWVTFSVAWHRRYLVPGEDVTVGQALMWRMRQTRFFLRLIGIGLIVMPVWMAGILVFGILGLALEDASSDGAKAIGVILWIVAMFVMGAVVLLASARLSLWLPAAAVEDATTLADVWRATRGNGWRLVFITILITIPLGIVGMVLQVALEPTFFEFQVYGWDGDAPDMAKYMEMSRADRGMTMGFITNLIYMAYYYVSVAVGVTGLSIAYWYLTGGDSRGADIDITA